MGISHTLKRIPAWAKISIGIVLLVLLVGTIGLHKYLNKLVNRRLREMVQESSNGLYRLEYGKVSMNAFNGNITIHKAELIPDSGIFAQLQQARRAPRFLVAGKVEVLSLKNVRWMAFMTRKKLKVDKILLEQPTFNLTQYRQEKDSVDKSPDVFQFISKNVKDLKLGLFSIRDAVIHYQVADAERRTINTIEHLDLGFTKVHFEGDNAEDKHLAADDYFINLKEYRHRTANSLYWLGINGFKYNSKENKASIDSFHVSPRYSETAFFERVGYQDTRYQLELRNISADGLDVASLMDQNVVRIQSMTVEGGSGNFYMNRSYPVSKEDKKNVVISQKILNLGIPLNIESFTIKDFGLTYKEYQPLTKRSAVLNFQGITAKAANVTNLPAAITRNPLMKVTAGARFLGAEVKAMLSFALNKTDGSFGATLDINQVAAEKLNNILSTMALMEAREGILQKLECTITGTANRAVADVKLLYEDLKINLLEKNGGELEKKGLKSMFANIMIFDDNPKDGTLRTASGVTLSRKHGKSFFNLAWSVVAAGILEVILKQKGIKLPMG